MSSLTRQPDPPLADAPQRWLPDANVWLALCSDRHEHHEAARRWFEQVREPVSFCRATQMALLRLLTNPKVMGADLLSPAHAIAVYRELGQDERVGFTEDPPLVEEIWFSLMTVPAASGSAWTDAWLAAFSLAQGSTLVSFDSGVRRWAGARTEILAR